MARALVVEGEAVAGVADLVNATGEGDERSARRRCIQRRVPGGGGLRGAIGRPQGVAREDAENVGQKQFLVLLLMGDAKNDQRGDARPRGVIGAGHQLIHRGVDVGAIGGDLADGGARQQAPVRSRMTRAQGLVIGIEQEAVAGIEKPVAVKIRLEQEGLEEPGGVRQMPLGRAGVRHRLDDLILGRKWRRERRRFGAEMPIRGNKINGAAGRFHSCQLGRAVWQNKLRAARATTMSGRPSSIVRRRRH